MLDLTVHSVGFSPVKGTRHLPLERLELDERGPVGDRSWCFVDVAARRVLRTVQHPSLIAVVAAATGGALELTLPYVEDTWLGGLDHERGAEARRLDRPAHRLGQVT